MKRIYSILLLAFMGAGAFASAQEDGQACGTCGVDGVAAAHGKRDRVADLTVLDAKLDQEYSALKNGGVKTATGIYVEAKGRVKST